MTDNLSANSYQLKTGRLQVIQRQVVEEYPLRLRVNDRELATLICSPHQLNFLLVGFFHLQGFVNSLDEIRMLGVCSESGLAEVRLKKDLPQSLQPTLTSGCGTGIAYNLPQQLIDRPPRLPSSFQVEKLIQLMGQLTQRSERYRQHGGIHSAGVGDHNGLLIWAEDIGRHNTIDRLAGEALFKKIALHDKMLVSSGRISTEMAAKAIRLGVGLIASRSTATDKAIELCQRAGITLVGYLRGSKMEIYSHPQQLKIASEEKTIAGVSGVILAGGESSRMGSDKSLLPIHGARFIDHVYAQLKTVFDEVIIVTNSPDLYRDIPCRKVPDIYYGQGALAGIHSGVRHASNEHVFVIGCDMPFVMPEMVRRICADLHRGDIVLPISSGGHEPLHALYGKSCLSAMEHTLDLGHKRILRFFDKVKVVTIPASDLKKIDPQEHSFQNINTPEEYYRLRGSSMNDGRLPELSTKTKKLSQQANI